MSRMYPNESPTEREARRQAMLVGVVDPTIVAAMQATFDRDDRIEAIQPVNLPPCPSWCRHRDLYAEHGYESVDPRDEQTFIRFHVSGQEGAYIAVEEYNRGGVVWFGTLHITPPEIEFGAEVSAEGARQLAAEILNAADLLDAIEAGQ